MRAPAPGNRRLRLPGMASVERSTSCMEYLAVN